MNHKYISRVDRGSTHGWDLNLPQLGVRRLFSDSAYGGREQSLAAALKRRDLEMAGAGLPLTERTVVTRSPRNRTGIIGVSRNERQKRFEIPTIGRGPTRYVKFGHDENAALREAARIRREMEREAYGQTVKVNWSRSLAVVNGDR